jgi:hypothetical protein
MVTPIYELAFLTAVGRRLEESLRSASSRDTRSPRRTRT